MTGGISNLLWAVVALPVAAMVLLALGGRRWGRRATALLGTGLCGAAAAIALWLAWVFISSHSAEAWHTSGRNWIDCEGLVAAAGLYLDPLAVVMMVVVSVVGFLILLYSVGYMAGDEGYARFFAYMNLFVAVMLLLVLADNLLLMYLGWEGVGLCSYLLISFWYRDEANVRAGRKAFIVTRIGDAALLLGILLLWSQLGTLDIQRILAGVRGWELGGTLAVAAAALILAGAVGKVRSFPCRPGCRMPWRARLPPAR